MEVNALLKKNHDIEFPGHFLALLSWLWLWPRPNPRHAQSNLVSGSRNVCHQHCFPAILNKSIEPYEVCPGHLPIKCELARRTRCSIILLFVSYKEGPLS